MSLSDTIHIAKNNHITSHLAKSVAVAVMAATTDEEYDTKLAELRALKNIKRASIDGFIAAKELMSSMTSLAAGLANHGKVTTQPVESDNNRLISCGARELPIISAIIADVRSRAIAMQTNKAEILEQIKNGYEVVSKYVSIVADSYTKLQVQGWKVDIVDWDKDGVKAHVFKRGTSNNDLLVSLYCTISVGPEHTILDIDTDVDVPRPSYYSCPCRKGLSLRYPCPHIALLFFQYRQAIQQKNLRVRVEDRKFIPELNDRWARYYDPAYSLAYVIKGYEHLPSVPEVIDFSYLTKYAMFPSDSASSNTFSRRRLRFQTTMQQRSKLEASRELVKKIKIDDDATVIGTQFAMNIDGPTSVGASSRSNMMASDVPADLRSTIDSSKKLTSDEAEKICTEYSSLSKPFEANEKVLAIHPDSSLRTGAFRHAEIVKVLGDSMYEVLFPHALLVPTTDKKDDAIRDRGSTFKLHLRSIARPSEGNIIKESVRILAIPNAFPCTGTKKDK